MVTQNLSNVWRIGKVAVVTLILMTTLFVGLALTPGVADAARHIGGNGPDAYPPFANCGAFVWGRAYVEGKTVANAVVTMSYLTRSITTTTLYLPQFENDGELYMFDARPCRELGAWLGSEVTISVKVPGLPPQSRGVRLFPNYGADEQLVDFFYGAQPVVFLPPSQPPLLPTTPITEMVSRHLLDAGAFHSCAIINGGGLGCWGYNAYGQVGGDRVSPYLRRVEDREGEVLGAQLGR